MQSHNTSNWNKHPCDRNNKSNAAAGRMRFGSSIGFSSRSMQFNRRLKQRQAPGEGTDWEMEKQQFKILNSFEKLEKGLDHNCWSPFQKSCLHI